MSDSSDMKGRDALQAAQVFLDLAAKLAETPIPDDPDAAKAINERLQVYGNLSGAQLNLAMNAMAVEAQDEQNDLNRKAAVAASLGIGGVPVGPSALRQSRGDKVRVGVKRFKKGFEVEEIGDEADAEVFQLWVEINGRRFTTEELGLIEVTYGSRSGDDKRAGVGYALIRVQCSGFETVDHRTPEEPADG